MSTAPLTPEEAAGFVMCEGLHAGRSLRQIDLAGGRDHLRWIAQTWARHDASRVREAVLAYLRFYPSVQAQTDAAATTP